MKLKVINTIVLVLLVMCSLSAVRAQQGPGPDFDKYINDALKEWQVPGLAIAIIKDDRVVFAKGYGTRELDKSLPVDEHTLFAIGSSSKAFTAASIDAKRQSMCMLFFLMMSANRLRCSAR